MLRILVLGLALLVPFTALAASSPAQALLEKMAQASRNQNYQGRFLYQFGSQVSTIEVRHAVFDGKEYQRLTHLNGRLSEVLLRGNELLCLHPDGTLTRIIGGGDSLFSFHDRLAHSIPAQYNVLVTGQGRVAGRAATRLRVAPLDRHRYGYRLWLDKASHLMLKSELIGTNGMALERVEFVTLDLHPHLTPADFQVPDGMSGYSLKPLPADRPHQVHIHTAWLPGGFKTVDQDWRRIRAGRPAVAARSFSDGLATFTVFVEPVRGGKAAAGIGRIGPTVTISRHVTTPGQDYQVTLVGEIPQATAERIMRGVGIGTGDPQ